MTATNITTIAANSKLLRLGTKFEEELEEMLL
jgi:hypothetical protein